MLSLGSVSIIALLSFIVGKIWSTSEAVFLKRQEAYERFLVRCPHALEFKIKGDLAPAASSDETDTEYLVKFVDNELMQEIREASAALTLYASPSVETLANAYMFSLGELLGVAGLENSDEKFEEANQAYLNLIEAMREDSLGVTYFGLQNRFVRRERRHLKKDT